MWLYGWRRTGGWSGRSLKEEDTSKTDIHPHQRNMGKVISSHEELYSWAFLPCLKRRSTNMNIVQNKTKPVPSWQQVENLEKGNYLVRYTSKAQYNSFCFSICNFASYILTWCIISNKMFRIVLCKMWLESVVTRSEPNELSTRMWFGEFEFNLFWQAVILQSQIKPERTQITLQLPRIMHSGRFCNLHCRM